MAKLSLVAVGKLKGRALQDGVAEYAKRVSRYVTFTMIETPDESDRYDVAKAKRLEGERLLAHLPSRAFVVAFDVTGERMTSPMFAAFLATSLHQGDGHVVFVIGGANGFDSAVLARANRRVSLSDMTFPHGLARLMALEQVYRAFRLMSGAPYHK